MALRNWMLKTTYALEGDRLEILLAYCRVEALRSYGRQLQEYAESAGLLPTLDVILARLVTPAVGMAVQKAFPGHGMFTGYITMVDKEDPEHWIYHIKYEDDDSETMDAEELLPLSRTAMHKWREYAVEELKAAYAYLENRLLGICDSSYDCSHTYLVFELAQLFDPSFVSENAAKIDSAWVKRLASVIPLARAQSGNLLKEMQAELSTYLSLTKGFTCEHENIDVFTTNVLSWWKNNGKSLPAWSCGARIRDDGPSSFGDVAQSGASPAAVQSHTEMPEHSAAAQQRAFPDESSAPVLQENAPLASTQRDDEPSSFGDVAQTDDPSSFGDVAQQSAPPAAVRGDSCEMPEHPAAARQGAHVATSRRCGKKLRCTIVARQRALPAASQCGDESSALVSQEYAPLAATQRDDEPSSFGDVAQQSAPPAAVRSDPEMAKHPAAARQGAPVAASRRCSKKLTTSHRRLEMWRRRVRSQQRSGVIPKCWSTRSAAQQRAFPDDPSSFGDVAQQSAPPAAVRGDSCEMPEHPAAARQGAHVATSRRCGKKLRCTAVARQRALPAASQCGDESSALVSQEYAPLAATQRDDEPSSFGDVAQQSAPPAAEYAPLAATQRDDEPSSFGDVAQSNAPPTAVRSDTEVLGRSAAAQQRAFPYESPALVPQENAPLAATQRDDEPSSFGDAVRQGESSALTSQGNTPLAVTQRDDGRSSFGDVAQSGASPAAVRSDTEMPEHSAAAQQRAFPYESPALVPQENAPLAATQRDDEPSSFGDAVQQGESSALTSQGNTPLAVTQRDDGPSSFGDVAQSGASPATVQSHTEMPEHSAAAQQRAFPDESSAPVLQENAPLASTQRDDEPSSFGDVAQTGALPAAVRSDTEMLEHSARSAAARVSR
ncbi:hypothetical protein CYMTET_38048 [Cymbomonas tetramitiformis]|uniref:PTM/DIR17-like Tudor domain-containing protein n=1 Tax=Cymbomonas tetramitiformis TaxID=36881 RepID=A0AAE0F621_9CHLO|nr:hypothetical protein CYMTET_38048 [Cymbomonas tetramitiformis]